MKKHDRNIIRKIQNKIKPAFFICLRVIDDEHCLCAFVKTSVGNNSLKFILNSNQTIFIDYESFTDINTKFALVAHESDNRLRNVVDLIYYEHQIFLEERRQKKEKEKKKELEQKELARIRRRKRIKDKRDKRIFEKENRQFETKIKRKLGLSQAKNNEHSNSEWNTKHTCSAGRGNF